MKIIYKTFKLKIANGTSEDSAKMELERGQVQVAVMFPNSTSTSPVSIKIVDTGGTAIIEPSNSKDWEQRNGGDYYSSKKPMLFKGGQQVKVVAYSDTNLTADFDFDVMLVIHQHDNKENH